MSGAPVRSRDISLGDDPGINGQLWDVNRIDITAQQGTWERWTYAPICRSRSILRASLS
ncbi:SufI protein [Salmonella enterica subsp. enterica]|nr:SufI protein [Salmonella enterica subsp. enterica]